MLQRATMTGCTWLKLRGSIRKPCLQCMANRLQRTVAVLTLQGPPIESWVTYAREVTVADPVACRRRARQCKHIAQSVRPGDVKKALLAIAKAWVKLAAQADAYRASEPRAPGKANLQTIDFLSIFRRTPFLKNG
jgi:hypothetical protein